MKKMLFFSALLCAGLSLAADERMIFAEGLARRGLHAQAATEYENLLKGAPASDATAEIRFRLGVCYAELGRRVEAIREFAAAAEMTDGDRKGAAQLRLAAELFAQEKTAEAQSLLEQVATGRVSNELRDAAMLRLGMCYEALGRVRDAETPYRVLAKGSDETARAARLRLAEVLTKLEKPDEALPICDAILADKGSENQHIPAAVRAFCICYAKPDFKKAVSYALKVPEKDLGDAGLLLSAAWAAARAERAVEARTWLAAEKRRSPKPTPDRLMLEGAIASALHDRPSAVTAYERLIAEFPKSKEAPEAAATMLSLRAVSGDPKDFLKHYARVSRLLSPEVRAQVAPYVLDASVNLRDRTSAGEAAAVLMLSEDPKVASEAAYRLAWLEQQLGEWESAGDRYMKLAERWPASPLASRAAYAAAYAFGQAKLPDRTDAALRLALASDDPAVASDALMLRARNALTEKDYPTAASSLDEYLTRWPNGTSAAEAAYFRGLIFFNAKDYKAAEMHFARALAANAPEEAKAAAKTEAKAGGPRPLAHALRTDASLRRAQCLQTLGRDEEAAALLQPLLQLADAASLDPAYLRWLADFRLGRKEWSAAEAAATALLARRELSAADRALGYTLKGQAAEGQGKAETAVSAYATALQQKAGGLAELRSALGLGRLHLASGAFDRAREALVQASGANLSDGEALRLRAEATGLLSQACTKLGDSAGALRADMSLIIFYDDEATVVPAFRRAAANLRAAGRKTEAETLVRECLQRYGKSL